jgi:hypothetical protein
VRLDATEDKGFFNLFSYSNSSAADMNKLKECIEEAKYQTTPSLNENSKLAYTNYANNGNSSSIKLSFTERNRFKTGVTPGTIKETYKKWETARSSTTDGSRDGDGDRDGDRDRDEEIVNVDILNPIETSAELLFKVPPPPNGVLSYGEIYIYPDNESFDLSRDNHFAATIGSGSTAEVYLNYDKFNLTKTTINNFINNANSAEKDNYRNAISSSHILYLTNENINFIKKAEALRNKCDDKVSDTCEFFGYGQAECAKVTTSTIKDYCNYDEEIQEFKKARQTLLTELTKIKKYVESDSPEDAPKMVFSMEDYYEKSKLVVNQKKLVVSFSDAWKFFFPILKSRMPGLQILFSGYNFSSKQKSIKMKLLADAGNELEFSSQSFSMNSDKTLHSSSWRNTFDNMIISPDPKPIFELDCPQGMGLADWDIDMSASSAFAWNYANTPSGATVNSADHENLPEITFTKELIEGHKGSTSKSVVDECIVPADRTHIYGFYVCKRLIIRDRTTPLHMIGTFIVKDLDQPMMKVPVYWYSVWDTKAGDYIMTDLNSTNPTCAGPGFLTSKTFNDIMLDDQLKSRMKACSALDLVTNGPNNFNWTTVDPDIGIATPGDSMTSQKANRIQKWIIKEESRVELIR